MLYMAAIVTEITVALNDRRSSEYNFNYFKTSNITCLKHFDFNQVNIVNNLYKVLTVSHFHQNHVRDQKETLQMLHFYKSMIRGKLD